MNDFVFALDALIKAGHTFQLSPSVVQVPDVVDTTVSVSGPSGSRQAHGLGAEDAVGKLCAQIVVVRLAASDLLGPDDQFTLS